MTWFKLIYEVNSRVNYPELVYHWIAKDWVKSEKQNVKSWKCCDLTEISVFLFETQSQPKLIRIYVSLERMNGWIMMIMKMIIFIINGVSLDIRRWKNAQINGVKLILGYSNHVNLFREYTKSTINESDRNSFFLSFIHFPSHHHHPHHYHLSSSLNRIIKNQI